MVSEKASETVFEMELPKHSAFDSASVTASEKESGSGLLMH
jgi:hypothetical protein